MWWAYTALLLVAAAMVTATAIFGGVMVYEHGVGTEPVMRTLPGAASRAQDSTHPFLMEVWGGLQASPLPV